jgi:hypothetical protein
VAGIPTIEESKAQSTLLTNTTQVTVTQTKSTQYFYIDVIPKTDRYMVVELDLNGASWTNYGYFLMANSKTLPWVTEQAGKIYVSGDFKGIFLFKKNKIGIVSSTKRCIVH